MLSNYKYECVKCKLDDHLRLCKADTGQFINTYYYTCKNDDCNFYLNTKRNTKLNIKKLGTCSGDKIFRLLRNNKFKSLIERKEIINYLKITMPDTLTHFIECNWGPHYLSQYSKIIYPFLDNLDIIKFILKGNHRPYGSRYLILDTYSNINGFKMYGELHRYLYHVKSQKIKNFISSEFGEIYEPNFLRNTLR